MEEVEDGVAGRVLAKSENCLEVASLIAEREALSRIALIHT